VVHFGTHTQQANKRNLENYR